jgi:DNA-binding NtrC family response regulator
MNLEQAAERIDRVLKPLRRREIIALVEGGPITEPAEAFEFLRRNSPSDKLNDLGDQTKESRAGSSSEREWVLRALIEHRYRRAETAAALGISRKTLYNKMARYGLL